MFQHPHFEAQNALHNLWGMSSTPLPVAAPTALERLKESQKINSTTMIYGYDARSSLNTMALLSRILGWDTSFMFNLRGTTAHRYVS